MYVCIYILQQTSSLGNQDQRSKGGMDAAIDLLH